MKPLNCLDHQVASKRLVQELGIASTRHQWIGALSLLGAIEYRRMDLPDEAALARMRAVRLALAGELLRA
jgi:hypothetical protein